MYSVWVFCVAGFGGWGAGVVDLVEVSFFSYFQFRLSEELWLTIIDTTRSTSSTPSESAANAPWSSRRSSPRLSCIPPTGGSWSLSWASTFLVRLFPCYLFDGMLNYVGSYILYTHMIAQRRKVMQKQK